MCLKKNKDEKKQKMDDKKYLTSLISQGEHSQQDFKYKVQDAVKLARSVSAFANTEGGRLLIGVRDDGNISGVRSEEEIYMMHAAAYKYCRPESGISFGTYHADGRTVVIATIPPATRKPVCAIDDDGKKVAFVRIADENIVASPVLLEIWRQEQMAQTVMHYTSTEQAFIAVMKANPQSTLNRLVRLSKQGRHHVIGTLARLVRYGIVKWEYEDTKFLFSLA
ncbi:ATP-dependent DNA helicase [Prevotella lacticifex]|uniref:ATP-dependent DNA helicase n=2 Tax=Prevotella lacticifex TaxID=2854755 RepID=A0A9R1CC01_9BACT|nr:ATP-dependent DNA helicase [Prevotella lacticifex]GJG44834.1 ATP-dependent DNA helicase [Prevotella lacticifex]GJG54394.1 ATP-dependent DNA helicase [Prevotella lacticifex]GJG59717.1 ATP-dependent DNA helicase [Prevotella lacticifex]GJG64322.1 ATP-dependent DNA helicase [Prevotella lacticifex]